MASASDLRISRRFENAVLAALRGRCGIAASTDGKAAPAGLVVAVSGGPDSLALLQSLARVTRGPLGRRHALDIGLTAAYFDHGLRDRGEVDEERGFVAGQAATLGLPFVAGSGDVPAAARAGGLSIEHAARRCRYRFLGEAAARVGAGAVAVGHTQTDQAETVLLRLIRGAGVAGLAAMDWRAAWPFTGGGPAIVRPLLGLRREDTEAYCAALGLAPRHDRENDSPRYLRNRVRHELLPLLATMNPEIVDALTRTAAAARDTRQFVESLLDARWKQIAIEDEDGVTLDRQRLAGLPAALRREALRRAAVLTGEGLPPVRAHVQAMEGLVRGAGGRVVELPGGVRAAVRGRTLRVWRTGKEGTSQADRGHSRVQEPYVDELEPRW